MGRVAGGTQVFDSEKYSLSYGYDLSGHVKTMTYPSGHVANYTYDTAARLSGVSGNLGDGMTRTYTSGIIYDAAGRLQKEQFGTDSPVFNKALGNSRGQLAEIRESTSFTSPTDTTWNRGKIINDYSAQCSGAGCNGTDNNGNLKAGEPRSRQRPGVEVIKLTVTHSPMTSLNRLQTTTENRYVSATNQTNTSWQQ